jgi:hypothetical protein
MNAPSELVEPLSRAIAQPVSWFWLKSLGRGKLSIFDGDPEMGKSFVTLDLCARATTGRPFPDGSPGIEPSNVIILSGEDTAEDTIVPRLQALGADLDRVFRFRKEFLAKSGSFCLPAHIKFLDEALAETHAALVIIDPIVAFLDPSIQLASDMSVRRALTPLAELSARHQCHSLMVRHLNKTGHFRSMYRGGGSIGFLAACRSGYLFAPDPQDPKRTVMAQIKNNLAPRQPSLTYRIQTSATGQTVLEWLGECPLGADQLLAAAGMKPYLPGQEDRARDFLYAFLEAGPRSTLEIWPAAAEQGLPLRTVQRAGSKNGIRSKTVWVDGRLLTYWLLEDQQLPAEIAPKDPDVPSLEPWLAPLRAKYPRDPLAPDAPDE